MRWFHARQALGDVQVTLHIDPIDPDDVVDVAAPQEVPQFMGEGALVADGLGVAHARHPRDAIGLAVVGQGAGHPSIDEV